MAGGRAVRAKGKARKAAPRRKAEKEGPLAEHELMDVDDLRLKALADFSDEREVLRVALANEKKGRNLYLQYARTLSNEMARKVFVHLANDELRHIEDIKEFMKSLEDGTAVDVDAMMWDKSLVSAKEFFGMLVEDLRGNISPGDDDNKCREVAMEIERAGYKFYAKGMEATRNYRLKKFFKWLVEQEQGHFLLIQNAFEYAYNPDSWFVEQERWVVVGEMRFACLFRRPASCKA